MKNIYSIHHENMQEHQTMKRLRDELIQQIADKPHPVSVQEIQNLVKQELTIFRDILHEELVKFLISFDESRR